MKQKNENKSDSAVYKSRTEPTQHIVVVNFDGSEPKEKCIEHEEVLFDRTDRVTFDLDAVPDHIRGSLAAQRSNWFQTSKRDRAEQHSWKRGQKLGEQAKFGP